MEYSWGNPKASGKDDILRSATSPADMTRYIYLTELNLMDVVIYFHSRTIIQPKNRIVNRRKVLLALHCGHLHMCYIIIDAQWSRRL